MVLWGIRGSRWMWLRLWLQLLYALCPLCPIRRDNSLIDDCLALEMQHLLVLFFFDLAGQRPATGSHQRERQRRRRHRRWSDEGRGVGTCSGSDGGDGRRRSR
jgi:hypothetical protein